MADGPFREASHRRSWALPPGSGPAASCLDAYLSEIRRHALLSSDEERRLARIYRETGSARAAHALVTANLRFVVRIAHQYRSYGVNLGDLIQEGNLGLMKAVQKFDPERGIRLVSYAAWWIRAYIHAHLVDACSVVKSGSAGAQRNLLSAFDRAAREVSLDAPIGEEGFTAADLLLADGPSQDEELSRAQQKTLATDRIGDALARLDRRERFIIEQRIMGDGAMTLKELGEVFGVSHERARALELRAKKKLKQELRALAAELQSPT